MTYDPYKSTWLNPNIEYLFNDEIIEFDLSDAGFSLITQYKLLSEEKIKELTLLGKGEERHIAIGKFQRDDKIFSKALLNKFAEIRMIFISANNLTDNNIISVKKDAIYTIGTCSKLTFGNLHFIPKNRYSSYIRFPGIQNLEVYYSMDNIDIKGMGDSAANRHRLYMLDFLNNTIGSIESKDMSVKRKIRQFISDYKSSNLEDMFYVEFNNTSRIVNPIFNYKNILIPLVQIIIKEIS